MSLQKYYSVDDLVTMRLANFPETSRGVQKKAKRENWASQPRKGRGGGLEYEVASMPTEIQQAIREHVLASLVIEPRREVAVASSELVLHETQKLNNLNDKQREIADARLAVLHHIAKMERVTTRQKAIRTLISSAENKTLDESLLQLVYTANARTNSTRIVSERTIMRWIADAAKCDTAAERLQALSPAVRVEKQPEELPWLGAFLKCYQKPNRISVAEAYDEFKAICKRNKFDYPSIHKVRRALEKMSKLDVSRGRVTGSERRAMLPYVKRDWGVLGANAVWVGDGTSLKAKVRHPLHGRPFTPELTMIIDASSRYIVGWSVSLAENTLAVADAFRNGVENHGLPLIYYSDNGAGQTANLLDADITGMFARLGVDHQTGIAGNPQGRGVIERLNKTLAHKVARQFPTCFTKDSDREAVRKTLVLLNSAANAEYQGKELTPQQAKALSGLPSWAQFIDVCEQAITEYNNEHIHRELGMTPSEARQQQLAETDITFLNAEELRDLFRPQEIRKVQRGLVSLFNNDYFSMDLADHDGDEVRVSFDIHNANSVIVRTMDGTYICDAQFDGNKRAAFPIPYVDKLRDDRRNNRLRLAQAKIAEIEAEHKGVVIDVNPNFASLFDEPPVAIEQPKNTIFFYESEKEEFDRKQLKQAE